MVAVRPARESGAYCVAGEDTWWQYRVRRTKAAASAGLGTGPIARAKRTDDDRRGGEAGFVSATSQRFQIQISSIFVRDYLRLAEQERSRELRSRLLMLARGWMHAAMQEEAETRPPRTVARFKMR